jgi:hypothetical protein
VTGILSLVIGAGRIGIGKKILRLFAGQIPDCLTFIRDMIPVDIPGVMPVFRTVPASSLKALRLLSFVLISSQGSFE